MVMMVVMPAIAQRQDGQQPVVARLPAAALQLITTAVAEAVEAEFGMQHRVDAQEPADEDGAGNHAPVKPGKGYGPEGRQRENAEIIPEPAGPVGEAQHLVV